MADSSLELTEIHFDPRGRFCVSVKTITDSDCTNREVLVGEFKVRPDSEHSETLASADIELRTASNTAPPAHQRITSQLGVLGLRTEREASQGCARAHPPPTSQRADTGETRGRERADDVKQTMRGKRRSADDAQQTTRRRADRADDKQQLSCCHWRGGQGQNLSRSIDSHRNLASCGDGNGE